MTVKVVCCARAPTCREWAVAFVSKYDAPVSAPRHDPDAPYDKPGRVPLSLEQALGIATPRFEFWYACKEHRQPFHRDLVGIRNRSRTEIPIATIPIDSPFPPTLICQRLMPPVCEYCGDDVGVFWEGSRTMYHEEVNAWTHLLENVGDAPPSPNRDRALCRECAAEHHSNWDEQWREYYSSQGC